MKIKKIPFSEIKGISVGNAENHEGKTGVTTFYFPTPATAAMKIFGGGAASREISVLDIERNDVPLNALIFGGGSSFGLEASTGAQKCLEESGIGIDTGPAKVPILCQSDIYDLSYGDSTIRPDYKMGYESCKNAMTENNPLSGNVGVGIGATVGKARGIGYSQKSGIGYAAAQIGDIQVGVAAVVNAYGDIYYHGQKIAGMLNEDLTDFADATEALHDLQPQNLFTGNTTLVAIFTNGLLAKSDLLKCINMGSAGMARAIRPVFTMADGDTIYCISVGDQKVKTDVNVVGTLAAELIEEAIKDAVTSVAQ
ncbi:MAG: P1 family peptidase [Bacteroidaceae bacterium]|nr:P1 family peptidase [Bacteroidaceae bacterium]